jgi:hypothetical protein
VERSYQVTVLLADALLRQYFIDLYQLPINFQILARRWNETPILFICGDIVLGLF